METNPTKIVLILEYDGTNYYGFQLQANKPEQPTIQSELEKAIFYLTGEELRVLAASRTDTGVHAKGQVVSFRTHSSILPSTFVNGLNHYLPEDIAVRGAYKVTNTFNVRHDALNREYCYYIFNSNIRSPLKRHFAYQVERHLNAEVMNQASQALIGEHDFASFTINMSNRVNTVRKVSHSEVKRTNEMITFNMTSNSFLPHQIRNTIGSLIQVGSGKMNVDAFYDMIKTKKPGLAGPRAPAQGLFLIRINYTKPFGEEN